MDERAAKLAVARQKLKDHQQKKTLNIQKDVKLLDDTTEREDTLKINTAEDMQNITLPMAQVSNDLETNQIIEPSSDTALTLGIAEVISTRHFEQQINELNKKLFYLEKIYNDEIQSGLQLKQHISYLESEVKNLNDKCTFSENELKKKTQELADTLVAQDGLQKDNINLLEQLELTKNMLTSIERDNLQLNNDLISLKQKLDATQLHLKQLTNDVTAKVPTNIESRFEEEQQVLLNKILHLEQQLRVVLKEKDQNNIYYEQYTAELNEQLKSALMKIGGLSKQVEYLSSRETSLIEQLSELEKRLQDVSKINHNCIENTEINSKIVEMENKYQTAQASLKSLSEQNEVLQQQLLDSQKKIKELEVLEQTNSDHNDLSVSKLSADIISDKVAAQRATEQNKKLKVDVQELQEAFVKLSKDKLELTEKIVAEKFLNRELTIKLSEIEEAAKDFQTKLMAKDEEMIRLQNSYRMDKLKEKEDISKNHEPIDENKVTIISANEDENSEANVNNNDVSVDKIIKISNEHCSTRIQKEEAMLKLQERFLKIMGEVADLSDEKHRLEHIIVQLQTETETICEYVALYQEQRNLLKKRDEERSAQIKIFKMECDQLKSQLDELSRILKSFAEDKELLHYFQSESKQNEIVKVMNLLSKLKNSTLIDPGTKNMGLHNFYPCSCCSGQLIEV